MGDVAIRIENLSKRYHIGARQVRSSFRETVIGALKAPIRRIRSFGRSSDREEDAIWALRDVSLDVPHGQVLGLIGPNGAGKSTLLKILSRITEPTSGRASIHGRVASLLEVGTGFHPELTGRENTFLSGAILGMSKQEITRKFDEIVEFSGVEKFIDTPVKRYSSGMKVRLGFAVAAHLEPEILLVDEVLSVGDAAFRKKCMSKMGSVAAKGRTVVLVSHDLGVISTLCERAILLENGSISRSGDAAEVVQQYLEYATQGDGQTNAAFSVNRDLLAGQKRDEFAFDDMEVVNPAHPEAGPRTWDPLILRLRYSANAQFTGPSIEVLFRDMAGVRLFQLSTTPISGYDIGEFFSKGTVELRVDRLPLTGGRYVVDVGVARVRGEWFKKFENVMQVEVQPAYVYNTEFLPINKWGLMVVDHKWDHFRTEAART